MPTTKKKPESAVGVTATPENNEPIQAVRKSAPPTSAHKEVDPNTPVIVKNGFRGVLVYTSARTGETYKWNEFGDEQEMELRELRNMKSSAKSFFTNNWVMFDPEYAWVIDELKVGQYYKNAISLDGFDDIFSKSPDEITSTIAGLSEGQRQSVLYRAKELIAQNGIDSLSVISALEKALGVQLTG